MVRLTGRQAVNYQGVQASSPPNFAVYNRVPTPTDWQNFYLGDLWEVSNTTLPQDQFVYMLVSLRNNIARWVRFVGGNGNLTSLTSNSGGTVFGDALQNINVVGDGTTITGVGNATPNTISFSVIGGMAANSFIASNVTTPTGLGGAAAPIVGVINVQANHNLNVSAGLPNTGAANDIVYWTTNASTWGDLVNLTAGVSAVTAFTGDITIAANNGVGNLNLPVTTSTGNAGIITMGGVGSASRWLSSYGTNNTFVGYKSGNVTLIAVDAFSNTALGTNSLQSLTTGFDNTAIGNQTLQLCTDGIGNTALGNGALESITTGSSFNTALGNQALFRATGGIDNVVIGSGSGQFMLTGSNNIMMGFGAGNNYISAESNNTIIGSLGRVTENNIIRLQTTVTTGDKNIFIGQGAIGAAYTVGVGTNNICIGATSFNVLSTGNSNVSMGALSSANLQSGSANCAFGHNTLNALVSTSSNTAIGFSSLSGITTGANNIAIGSSSGTGYTGSESNNILVGNLGTAAESNVIRIGGGTGTGATQQNLCNISGIRGITTASNTAIAVLIDVNGQLGTVSSSARFKEHICDIGDFSSSLLDLRTVKFNYKSQTEADISFGLIAEEVNEIVPELVIYDREGLPETVKYLDLIPLMLNELQKLNERIKILEQTKQS